MDASETAKAIGETVELEQNSGGKTVEIVGENGVLASAITPKNSHLWVKGQSGNPAGRPTKAKETAVLNLMRQQIDPQKVVATVLDLMEDSTSWRAREAGVKLYLAYMVGMPVQRSVTATTRLESILNRLGEMDDTEFGEVEQALKAK